MHYSTLAASLFAILASSVAIGEDWPGWRGPRGDGSIHEDNVPIRWSANENIAWKVPVPYGGHSSPVVSGETVFLTGADEQREARLLLAFDRATGELRWERVVLTAPLEKKHQLNSYASSTPATDGERTYVSFLSGGSMVIAAYDFDGNEVWKVEPGIFSSIHGYCSSPVLYEDMVIVNGDHDGEAYLVALDRRTGETVWKTPRENRVRSYCTPIIRELDGRTQMILSGSECVASYDPKDGSRHWIIDGPTEQFVASLVENEGLIFVTGGFPDKHILAIDPSGEGNVTDSHIRWRHRRGVSYVPSPVAAGDGFYVVADNGIATCFDAQTGEVRWEERMGRHYSASLVATRDHVYFLDDDGNAKVVKVGPKFELVAENPLGEATYASPAASNGQLFIRGENHLYCIGLRN